MNHNKRTVTITAFKNNVDLFCYIVKKWKEPITISRYGNEVVKIVPVDTEEEPETMNCQCEVCKRSERFLEIVNKLDQEEDKNFLLDILNHLYDIEEYAECMDKLTIPKYKKLISGFEKRIKELEEDLNDSKNRKP